MRIVFFGSSDFSIPSLEACLKSAAKIVAVITTPDQPKGRGLQLTPTPVRLLADQKKIPCLAPETLKEPEILQEITALAPDIFVIASYGKMVPATWLEIPKWKLNVHPSLLPKYRGAAPIHWPILNGDSETGVSIAEITPRLDAGDIFTQERTQISPAYNSKNLTDHLAHLSAAALLSVLQKISSGETLTRTAQEESRTCYARKLTKSDSRIDWKRPATEISNQIRGLQPWPMATTQWNETPLQILEATIGATTDGGKKPGEIMEIDSKAGSFTVQTGSGTLRMKLVKPAGKKEMSAGAFAQGYQLRAGSVFPS